MNDISRYSRHIGEEKYHDRVVPDENAEAEEDDI